MNCPDTSTYALSLQRFSELLVRGDAAVTPYTRNFLGGQAGALRTNFPCTCDALGSRQFAALANVYSAHYPSCEWDLNLYGAGFPGLLLAQENNPRAAASHWRLLAAIARVEYSITASYYAKDAPETAGGSSDCGEHGLASLLMADDALTERWSSAALQRRNPFADIPEALVFNQEVAIYRQGWRVKVCQAGSNPASRRTTACPP